MNYQRRIHAYDSLYFGIYELLWTIIFISVAIFIQIIPFNFNLKKDIDLQFYIHNYFKQITFEKKHFEVIGSF